MKENKFQKQVKKQLESQGAFIINLHGHLMQQSGLPDLQVIHRKWKGFLELKVEKNEANALQRIVAAKIELRGAPIYVLRCVEVEEPNCYEGGYIPSISKKEYKYTLENFQEKVIETINDLSSLLGVLVKLEKGTLYCEYLHEGEQPTGDEKTCKEQCITWTRINCRRKWRKNNEGF